MSHFTVLVVGNNVEQQLAPFHEFECTGHDEYVQEVDDSKELRKDYEEHEVAYLVSPPSTDRGVINAVESFPEGDDRFFREPTEKELANAGPLGFLGTGWNGDLYHVSKDWGDGRGHRSKIHFVPEGWSRLKLPASQVMKFSEFVHSWVSRPTVKAGETPDLEKIHKYGYTLVDEKGEVIKTVKRTNPDKKWDWYQVGGRWDGFLRLKNGDKANSALKREIDFEGMLHTQRLLAEGDYDTAMRVIKTHCPDGDKIVAQILTGVYPWPSWQETRARFPEKHAEAVQEYNSHPIIKALRGREETAFLDIDSLRVPRAEYVKRTAADGITTHAVLKDGTWSQAGKMGWWAIVLDQKDVLVWADEFQKIIDSVSDDTLLTVVDCHI
jgi:hypothetical protein